MSLRFDADNSTGCLIKCRTVLSENPAKEGTFLFHPRQLLLATRRQLANATLSLNPIIVDSVYNRIGAFNFPS